MTQGPDLRNLHWVFIFAAVGVIALGLGAGYGLFWLAWHLEWVP